jgi:copper resistance protein B
MHEFHDNDIHSYLLLERLETWRDAGSAGATWEGKGWMGTDVTRLWLRTEGERFAGQTHGADVELLYGRSVSPWWDVVAGMRQDFAPGGSRTFAAIGLQGLAPQRYEVAATAYFGSGNQGALRLEAGREVLLTNRLIAQPRLELTLFSQDDVRHGIAAGLYEVEAGLRLRYEITRQFAPYFGLSYVRATGDTAALRRDAGEAAEDLRVVAGLRLWF